MMSKPNLSLASPQEAIEALGARLRTVEAVTMPLSQAAGRILRQPLFADRDSPAADVSAMDGYAVSLGDIERADWVPISGESAPGHEPPSRQAGKVVRIFTGGAVPAGFDAVIRREDTEEEPARVRFDEAARAAQPGQNIRRRGENAKAAAEILPVGQSLHAGAIAAAANFGAAELTVSRPVRVALIVTGDELRTVQQSVEPWQLRDSNGITLAALFAGAAWIKVVEQTAVEDSLAGTCRAIQAALQQADAVVLTGGVSMGDYDHVPAAVQQAGGEIVFHQLPIRPGKPILGAVDGEGRPIVGLPGNPVSAAVGARRFLWPWLRSMAGGEVASPATVTLVDPPAKTLPLHWMRLVHLDEGGRARLVPSRGSGDLVSLAHSSGFVEQPPDTNTPGPWPYWPWPS